MRTHRQITSFMIRWLLFFCGISLVYVGLRYRLPSGEHTELPFQEKNIPYPMPEKVLTNTDVGPGAKLIVYQENNQSVTTLLLDIGDDRNPLARLHGKDLKGLTLYADHWLALEFEEAEEES